MLAFLLITVARPVFFAPPCVNTAVWCTVDDGKSYVLSVALAIGDVLLMSNYDDICPKVIHTSLAGLSLYIVNRWSDVGVINRKVPVWQVSVLIIV